MEKMVNATFTQLFTLHFFCMQMEHLFLSIYRFETYLQRANLCKSIFSSTCVAIQDSAPQIPDTRQWIPGFFASGTWILILIVSRIPDSLSCIPDSKTQGCGFHNQRLPTDFEIQIPLPGATIVSVDRDQRKDCSLSLSLLPKFSLFFSAETLVSRITHIST